MRKDATDDKLDIHWLLVDSPASAFEAVMILASNVLYYSKKEATWRGCGCCVWMKLG